MKKKLRPQVKVFLVDDHPAVREGVRAFLARQASLLVVGEASDAPEALRKVKLLAPDVIILDVNLPSLDGGELARQLRQAVPRARIIAFSVHAGQEYVVRMARCGAHGYITKDAPTSRLAEAIRHVHQGGLYFPPEMSDAILAPGAKPAAESSEKGVMTSREREVLTLLAEGLSNKEVARKLGISVRTAETHREHLSHKLKIPTMAGLTKYAILNGLTPLGIQTRSEP